LKDLARLAIDTASSRGAGYADARVIEIRDEELRFKNGEPAGVERSGSTGLGIRVLVGGAWGFAATDDLSTEGIARCAGLAVSTGRASAQLLREPVRLAPEPPHRAVWTSPCRIDPFLVPLADKLDLLSRVDAGLRSVKGVRNAESFLRFLREHQWYVSSEGSDIEQTLTRSGGGMLATAVRDGDIQRRSFPASEGGHLLAGWEHIESVPWVETAPRVAEEAVALLQADQCPAGTFDVVLDGSQLALQIHESVGHPTELDRVLGMEANYAGTSFLTLEKRNSLQFGSPIVNLVADATLPGGLATFAYDDEGVEAQRWALVEGGRFVAYLTSRELARRVGEPRSRGCVRADGWHRIPMIRMVNLSLMPGRGSLEELLGDTDHGIYMETNRSWSIDQLRYNFQFKTEIAWEIRRGKRIRMLRNPTYQGITTQFWNSCDAICGESEWKPWSVVNCGKGQPGQVADMSHGAAPARFRRIRVGAGYEG
jgi:TldD protein